MAVAALWSARRPIATDAIDRALAARGVAARYTVRDVGLRTQRLERVSIGDPARPDVTVDWAEIDVETRWGEVRVTQVRARGVILRGALMGSRVSFGAIDRLLPKPTGEPFKLPAIDVALGDARLLLATPQGNVGVRLNGAGRLDRNFRGQALVAARRLGSGDCAAERVRGRFDVTTAADARRRVRATGPVRFARIECQGANVAGVTGTVNAALVDDGAVAEVDLRAAAARYRNNRANALRLTGRASSVGALSEFAGRVTAARISPEPTQVAGVAGAIAGGQGTPVAPLLARLQRAIAFASRDLSGGVDFSLRREKDIFQFAPTAVQLQSRSGARLRVTREWLPVGVVPNLVASKATLALSGGALPTLTASADQLSPDGSWRGVVRVAPYASDAARLELAPLRIVVRRDGAVRVEGSAVLDGPVADGRVSRLRVPIVVQRAAMGALIVQPGCAPVAFDALMIAGARIGAQRANLCPVAGGAWLTIANGRTTGGAATGPLRLAGTSGSTPFSLAAARSVFDLRGPIRADGVAVRLGRAPRVTRLDVVRVDGSLAGQGRFTGLAGQIGGVPLIADAGSGTWRVRGGALSINGTLRIADSDTLPRFKPLMTRDAALTLRGNRIAATATLTEPTTGRAITRTVIAHDLASGSGDATLAVDGLTFGKTLQPEALTRLTVGVVAEVEGRIDGTGRIAWTPQRVTSNGRFTTANLDFAAPFGPVSGARGTILFDDLLALSTPPGQRATLALVNPGIEVKDGVIDYRLLPNQRVAIERGRWPFAGGALLLAPTTIDFGKDATRTLTFRVDGLDAAKFIDQLKLENIAATGLFDGDLPIVFDATGGRIVGGRLVARGAGTLAYVGDVSNADIGTYGKLAFDALKAIRYDRLTIDLDGALDGEIVSSVRFDGVNEAPVASTGTARRLTGLPFRFNIVIRAPFRGLVGTARSLQDPRGLLRPVQPPASAPRP